MFLYWDLCSTVLGAVIFDCGMVAIRGVARAKRDITAGGFPFGATGTLNLS